MRYTRNPPSVDAIAAEGNVRRKGIQYAFKRHFTQSRDWNKTEAPAESPCPVKHSGSPTIQQVAVATSRKTRTPMTSAPWTPAPNTTSRSGAPLRPASVLPARTKKCL